MLSRPCAIAVARRLVASLFSGLDQLCELRPTGAEVISRTVLTLADGTVLILEARRPA